MVIDMFWLVILGVLFQYNFAAGSILAHRRSIAPSTCTLSPATTTINSQADVTGLASCVVIDGSIVLSPSATGAIALDGPQGITGDLVASGANNLSIISSLTLTTISGKFSLTNLSLLQVVNFPSLVNIGTMEWLVLPALVNRLGFGGVITIKSVIISSTGLSLIPDVRPTDTFNMSNNTRMGDTTVKSTHISTLLSLDSNSGVFSFPNLTWAASITAESGVKLSLPSLIAVNGSFKLNTMSMSSLDARSLQSVGSVSAGIGDFHVTSNAGLTNWTLNSLQSVGGSLQIVGNAVLDTIDLPALKTIGENSVLSGGISRINMLQLSSAKGGITVASTNASLTCSGFNTQMGSTIKGNLNCSAAATTLNASSTNGTGDQGSITAGTKIGIGITIPSVAIMASILYFVWKTYKKGTSAEPTLPAELPRGGHHEATELPVKETPRKLDLNIWSPVPEAYELYGDEQYYSDLERTQTRHKERRKTNHHEEVHNIEGGFI